MSPKLIKFKFRIYSDEENYVTYFETAGKEHYKTYSKGYKKYVSDSDTEVERISRAEYVAMLSVVMLRGDVE